MRKVLLLLCMLSIGISAFAQAESDAKRINTIKKDKSYLWAECTSETEEVASITAKSELDDRIDEFIQESGIEEGTKTIIVKNIGKFTNNIKMKRGDMVRVFFYVSKSDIINSSSDVTLITIKTEDDVADDKDGADVPVSQESTEDPLQKDDEVVADGNTTPVEMNTSSDDTHKVSLDAYDDEAGRIYFGTMPEYRKEIIRKLTGVHSIEEAYEIIKEECNLRRVKNYGKYEECKDRGASYWIVTKGEDVSILSSIRQGRRWNYNTRQYDHLQNYASGIWFRF